MSRRRSRSYSSPNRARFISRSRSRSVSYSPRRSRSRSRTPRRVNRSYSRSFSRSYSKSPRYKRSLSRSPNRYRRRYSGDRDNPKPSTCIGVFGLSLKTDEKDLYRVFQKYGEIKDVQLVLDNYTGRSRGFGFIYYEEVEAARNAKDSAHGIEIDGRVVRIDYSITRKAHTPTPGVYLGKKSTRRGGYGYGNYDDRDPYSRRSPDDRRRYRSRSPYGRSRSRSYTRRNDY